MDTTIALIVSGFLVTRVVAIAGFGYLLYRILRPEPARVPVRSRSNYARERAEATRRTDR